MNIDYLLNRLAVFFIMLWIFTFASPVRAQIPTDITPIVSTDAMPLDAPDAVPQTTAYTSSPAPESSKSFWVTGRPGHQRPLAQQPVAASQTAIASATPNVVNPTSHASGTTTAAMTSAEKRAVLTAFPPAPAPATAPVLTASATTPAPPGLAPRLPAPAPAPTPAPTPAPSVTTAIAPPAALQSDFTSALPVEEHLHVIVGRSVFINTHFKLKRVYITNPAVLDSYTATPNQILCTAKQTGVSSLILWDDHEMSHTYLVSSDVDVAALQGSLKQTLPHEDIRAVADGGKIVLTGTVSTDAVVDTATKLAAQYSKDVSDAMLVNPAKIKQVELKVRIVEVDRSKLDQLGFNIFSAGGNTLASSSTNQFSSMLSVGGAGSATASTVGNTTVAVTNPLNFLFYSSKYNIGATLQDLATQNILQILAEPTITTISGQKADFLAGGEFPFPVVQGSSTGTTSITIQFRSYGVKVEFTPVVNTDGTIDLKVAPEVSALDFTNAVTISGYTIPALSTRRAETQVVLNSGESFAISGLLDRRATDSFSKTPGIANVPILGELFKSKNVNHSTSELIVVVTPTTVEPLLRANNLPVPTQAVPMLDPHTFDTKLPKRATKPSAGPQPEPVPDTRP
jgi:pilus assembly protein CpaC